MRSGPQLMQGLLPLAEHSVHCCSKHALQPSHTTPASRVYAYCIGTDQWHVLLFGIPATASIQTLGGWAHMAI